jgi:hypothetical protein
MSGRRPWGTAALAAAAVVLVLVGSSGLTRGGDRASDGADALPPVVAVDGVDVLPAAYSWYSVDAGTRRGGPPAGRPRSPEDFPVTAQRSGPEFDIRLGRPALPERFDVTFFQGVGADGPPVGVLRTRHCTTDAGCRWEGGGAEGRLRVPVADGAGFVAITLAEDVPDFSSSLPVTRVARYGVVLRRAGGDDRAPASPPPTPSTAGA